MVGTAAEAAWQTKTSRRPWSTPSPQIPTARRRSLPSLPTSKPPRSRIPLLLHGRCYNRGDERHISPDCTRPTFCVCCNGEGHIVGGCTRPRPWSTSPWEHQARLPLVLRHRAKAPLPPPPPPQAHERAPIQPPTHQEPAQRADMPLPLLPGPPPAGAIRIIRPRSQVVHGESMGSVPAPGFSMPFSRPMMDSSVCPLVHPHMDSVDETECCYMEASNELVRMEADLACTIVVTVTRKRPEVDLASSVEALHAEFGIGPNDM
ncbi:hypothetical protein VPH35_116802 [Triticum aestivum]